MSIYYLEISQVYHLDLSHVYHLEISHVYHLEISHVYHLQISHVYQLRRTVSCLLFKKMKYQCYKLISLVHSEIFFY